MQVTCTKNQATIVLTPSEFTDITSALSNAIALAHERAIFWTEGHEVNQAQSWRLQALAYEALRDQLWTATQVTKEAQS